jgi:hypothetical protein
MLFLRGEDTAGRKGNDVAHQQGHDEVDDIGTGTRLLRSVCASTLNRNF